MKLKTYYLYILKCADGTFYTGVTNNLDRRLNEHEFGVNEAAYTFKRRPLELQFYEEFQNIIEAIEFEKKIKGWSGKKKQALIDKNWDKLKQLSECRNESNAKNFRQE